MRRRPGDWAQRGAALGVLLAALGAEAATQAPASAPAPANLEQVGVTERLNEPIPRELSFVDSTGRPVRLGELLGGDKPVVLTLVYYRCPMLCSLVLSGLTRSLGEARMRLGEDYRAITVSIDPEETPAMAAEKKRGHLQALGVPADSPDWPFLTGTQPAIKALAEAVGFRYSYDAQLKQYAHAAVMFVLTPEGRISRYLYGMETPPRDLRWSLVEASGGWVGTSFDRVLLTCYQYDPATRRYGFFVKGFLRTGGMLVFTALATLLGVLWRRELKRGRAR